MTVRTLVLAAIAVWSLVATHPADAQSAARTWRIGFLSLVSEDLEQYKPWLAAFRDGLRQLGYVEGETLVIEQRYAAGRIELLPALAAELVRLKVDVLVTAPAGTAVGARKATSTIPIVFMPENPAPITMASKRCPVCAMCASIGPRRPKWRAHDQNDESEARVSGEAGQVVDVHRPPALVARGLLLDQVDLLVRLGPALHDGSSFRCDSRAEVTAGPAAPATSGPRP